MLKQADCSRCAALEAFGDRKERRIQHLNDRLSSQENRHRMEIERVEDAYKNRIARLENVQACARAWESSRDSLLEINHALTAELYSVRRWSPVWWIKRLAQRCTGKV